jgi:hypothetical protein
MDRQRGSLPRDAQDTPTERDLRSAAAEGYVYGVAPVAVARTRALFLPLTGVNRLHHSRLPADPGSRTVVAPNVDTLYTHGWLDLRGGPALVTIPDDPERYRIYQLMDIWSNTFASLGAAAGRFAVVPPGFEGELPADADRIASPSWDVWLLGRTRVSGAADLDAARRVQRSPRLDILPSPIDGAPPQLPAGPAAGPYALPEPKSAFFEELAGILEANPAPAADAPVLGRLAALGVVAGAPGQPRSRRSVAALEAGIDDALARLAASAGKESTAGWTGSFSAGVYGTDYATRAVVARDGLGAGVPEQALYYFARADGSGEPLSGERAYRLRFPAGLLPPFGRRGFWSLTMYGADRFLVANRLDRYAVGDRSGHLVYEEDGSLEIRLGRTAPAAGESNWLPAPSGPFVLGLRLYVPRIEARSRRWWPAAVEAC